MNRTLPILMCGVLLCSLAGCNSTPQGEVMDPTVTVETTTAQQGALQTERTYIGTISAEGTASVVAMVSGTVETVDVSVGDTVAAGQLLCTFDDTSAQLALENAQLAYQNALVGIENANANIENAQAGYQTAQAGVQSAQAGAQNAQSGVDGARAGVESARSNYQSALAGAESAEATLKNAQAGLRSAQAALESAQLSYQSALANYGGDENGKLTILEEQIRMAQENYDATLALLALGAASQIEVDQAKQALQTAQAGLTAAQANLSSIQASLQQAEAGVSSAEAGVSAAQAGVNAAQATLETAKAAVSSAEAGVGSAQAGISSAQAGIESAQAGVSTAKAGMTAAQAGAKSARANVDAAQVGIESAEYQLTLYHLTSPISGVVEAVNVTANNFAPSGNVAFVISNAQNKTVTFYVTDEIRANLQQGQGVTVTGGGGQYSGIVTEISGVVDTRTGLFQIKAVIEGAQDLPDGLTVELATTSRKVDRAIIIPSDALYYDNGAAYVYRAQDGTAVRTPVTVALYTADSIAVTDGLSAGDEIITSWSAGLTDGVPIRHTSEQSPAQTTTPVETAGPEETEG